MSATLTADKFEAFNSVLDEIAAANADRSWSGAGDASVSRAVARVREAGSVLRERQAAA